MSGSQLTETETNAGASEFMLFGVRVVVDSMRKSVSLNNLSQYQHRDDAGAENVVGNMAVDYASADETIHHSSTNTNINTNSVTNRERKRGVPWTEEEHKLFLAGLQKVGKGDWRGISRTFVKTRTPTQVASHAQKYFLRRSNLNRRRRRSSLFDITTDSVAANSSNDQMSKESMIRGIEIQSNQSQQEQQLGSSIMQANSFDMPNNNVKFTLSASPIYNPLAATQVVSPAASNSSKSIDFDLNTNTNTNTNTSSLLSFDPSPLSLNLSLSVSTEASKATAFQVMQGFRNPDGMISVA